MTRTDTAVPIHGTVRRDSHGLLLVLDQRIESRDTYLSGLLDLGEGPTAVSIITLDDITVLRPKGPIAEPEPVWTGTLHLPAGIRPRQIPDDLAAAARFSRRDLSALDSAELRYALTFLSEASTEPIRAARIAAIVTALPPKEGGTP
jgi:hypothetical protein